jgi:hypothetical protein
MSSLRDAISTATGEDPTEVYDALDTIEADAHEGAESSVLRAVRNRSRQLQGETTVDLEVPGYGGVLVGRYRAISIARVFNGPGGTMRNPITDWAAGADALATALVELCGRNPDTGDLEPLFHDQSARFDNDLVDALGLTPPSERTARAVMVSLFGGSDQERGESRIWQHYLEYQAWLTQGSASEVADQAVGEY